MVKKFDVNLFFANKSTQKRELSEFSLLMEILENPQKDFKSIQVAGTNAKGSTCCFLGEILKEQGYKTAVFSSPSLSFVNERFLIDGAFVCDYELEKAAIKVDKAQKKLKKEYCGFDLMCACAFVLFSQHAVEFAVLETGLGGRYDATNIVESEFSIITPISLDHTQILGKTVAAIAKEKSFVLKAGQQRAILFPQKPEVMDVLQKRCNAQKIEYICLDKLRIKPEFKNEQIQEFLIEYIDGVTYCLKTQMLGTFQMQNACAAFVAAKQLECDVIAINQGISKAFLPARMELLRGNPDVLIDGAHNTAGADIVVETIKEYYEGRNIILITSIMKDKHYSEIIKKLCSVAKYCIAVQINDRAVESNKIVELARQNGVKAQSSRSYPQAFVEALLLCEQNDNNLVLVAGSLYLAGAFRDFLLK